MLSLPARRFAVRALHIKPLNYQAAGFTTLLLPKTTLQHNTAAAAAVAAARSFATDCEPTTMRRIKIKLVPAPCETEEKYIEHNQRIGRALSPALSIYKPQLTSMLSISLRMSGVVLTVYAWLLGMTGLLSSHDLQDFVEIVEGLGLGDGALFVLKYLVALPFAFHYLNGLRNLIWLTGAFLTKPLIYMTGYITIAATIVLTFVLASLRPACDDCNDQAQPAC